MFPAPENNHDSILIYFFTCTLKFTDLQHVLLKSPMSVIKQIRNPAFALVQFMGQKVSVTARICGTNKDLFS
uniref:Uncharacterized protein MANES_02G152300 n=1 Tax=Rhizophora mucronata TaxID=61149 RepID=A0A2P2MD22_RHIMU